MGTVSPSQPTMSDIDSDSSSMVHIVTLCTKPVLWVLYILVTIMAIMGAVEAHMMETARGLFIGIIVLEFGVMCVIIIGKFIKRDDHSMYEVTRTKSDKSDKSGLINEGFDAESGDKSEETRSKKPSENILDNIIFITEKDTQVPSDTDEKAAPSNDTEHTVKQIEDKFDEIIIVNDEDQIIDEQG